MDENNKTKLDLFEDLQPLIQKEISDQFPKLYEQYANKFGVADVPLHYHNGFDAPNIPGANVVPSLRASGSIKLATNGQRYTLQLTGNPSLIQFYGNAIHRTAGVIDIRAIVIGSACLGPSYFFQPLNTTTVSPSEMVGNVIQSSTMLLINNSGAGSPTLDIVSEGHIVSAEFPGGTVVARATVPNIWTGPNLTSQGYGSGYVFLDVELAAGWEINGNFVVT